MGIGIILTLIIGAIAGWLGSVIFKGSGLGLLGNIIIGILGSFVGGWLLGRLGIASIINPTSELAIWINAIITGAIGAIVILFVINLVIKLGKK